MSELIAAKAKGDLLDRYKEGKPKKSDDKTESEYVRELLDEGLRAREEPLYVRLGLPNRHAARLEDSREPGEGEEDAVRRALRDAVEAWDDDVLDTLGASDELRERVDSAREEGESLDDAVRRLLRTGVESSESAGPASLKQRLLGALAVVLLMIAPVGSALIGDGGTAMLFVLLYASLILFNPQLNRLEKFISDKFWSLGHHLRR